MYRWSKPIPSQDRSKIRPIILENNPPIRRQENLSYRYASQKFDEVCAWISSLGLNIAGTRIQRYQRILKDLAKSDPKAVYVDFLKKYDLHQLTNTTYEADQLMKIYEGLKHETHPQLKERLRRVLKGHELFAKDNNSGARDFSLELELIARFAKNQFSIDYSHLADLAMDFNGTPVFAECKRLTSLNKVETRIKEALTQLAERYATHSNPAHARGMIVLSIGALLHPNLQPWERVDEIRLSRGLETQTRKFFEANRRYWEDPAPDPRTIGVITICNTPAIVKRRVMTCHQLGFELGKDLCDADVALAKQILRNLEPAAIASSKEIV